MKAGQIIHPEKGETILCTRSATEEGGRFEFELTLQPGQDGPPMHCHAEGPEIIEVISGKMAFRLDGTERLLGPGDRVEIPVGSRHTFRNPSKTEAVHARCVHGPRFERLVDQLAGASGFARMSIYLTDVDPQASWMINPVIRFALRAVAAVGRLRGIRTV